MGSVQILYVLMIHLAMIGEAAIVLQKYVIVTQALVGLTVQLIYKVKYHNLTSVRIAQQLFIDQD